MRDPAVVAARRARSGESHVAPLAAHAAAIRERRVGVPDFDPAEAGVRARLLVLLEAPGAAARASGFVSADNDDGTAASLWAAHRAAGTDRAREVVTWNAVPWYLDHPAGPGDVRAGAGPLSDLLGLLPRLRAVVLLGRAAQRGWRALPIDLPAVPGPHPSAAEARDELHAAIAVAREQAGLA